MKDGARLGFTLAILVLYLWVALIYLKVEGVIP